MTSAEIPKDVLKVKGEIGKSKESDIPTTNLNNEYVSSTTLLLPDLHARM